MRRAGPYGQSTGWRSVLAPLLAGLFLAALIPATGLCETYLDKERAVKAAVLYHLGKFIHWPEALDKTEDFSLCLLGTDPFGDELTKLVGKKVRGRFLAVKRLKEIADKRCHILFISSSEDGRLSGIVEMIGSASILTVGDMRNFAQRGGIVALRTVKGRITLDVNLEQAQAVGLKVSAKLLKLARIVTTTEPTTAGRRRE